MRVGAGVVTWPRTWTTAVGRGRPRTAHRSSAGQAGMRESCDPRVQPEQSEKCSNKRAYAVLPRAAIESPALSAVGRWRWEISKSRGCPSMSVVPLRLRIIRHGWGRYHRGAVVNVLAADTLALNRLLVFEGGKKAHLAAEGKVWERVRPVSSTS
jgi:hypothetical protein